jgi:hypothetical protein
MFILDGKPLSPDRAFTTSDGRQFPANWLRLSTPAEREALGITEQPDPPTYDQRFYWGYDNDGSLIPKDHVELVDQWTAQVKVTAGTLLAPTDWYIVRESETGLEAPQSVLDRRSAVRDLSNGKEAFLRSTASTEELAAYVTSQEFSSWENMTTQPVDEPSVVDGFTSGSFVTADSLFGGFGEDTLTF